MSKDFNIPEEVKEISHILTQNGYESYLVGGCVRDMLIGKRPKDWDITTNATPEQIQGLFEETFYDNDFGTVGVVTDKAKDASTKVVEVTPYRTEAEYSDARRPDKVEFGNSLEDDLQRRDFTINAIAYSIENERIVDLYKGQVDLTSRTLRTVGDPAERFGEDALRMLRAVRLATELCFHVEQSTQEAIKNMAKNLSKISVERIRDEFSRILLSDNPMDGILMARELNMLPYIAPDLERAVGVEQNYAHKYDVFEHLLRTLQHAADKKYSLELRLAALYHDISKPETRRKSEKTGDWTFYGHEVVGSRVTKRALTDLRYPKKTVDYVQKLVRWHMFFSDPDKITLSAVRRMITNVSRENIWDLLNLRICDRIGSGRPKEQPFRFRKYKSMVEQALRDPISVTMLNIDGKYMMETLGEKPGPRIGYVLHALLEETIEDSEKNTEDYLGKRARALLKLSDEELKSLGEQGKRRLEEEEKQAVQDIQAKYWVS